MQKVEGRRGRARMGRRRSVSVTMVARRSCETQAGTRDGTPALLQGEVRKRKSFSWSRVLGVAGAGLVVGGRGIPAGRVCPRRVIIDETLPGLRKRLRGEHEAVLGMGWVTWVE